MALLFELLELALVQGNNRLLKESGKTMLYTTIFCLLIGIVLASAMVFQLHGLGHTRMGASLPRHIASIVVLLVDIERTVHDFLRDEKVVDLVL